MTEKTALQFEIDRWDRLSRVTADILTMADVEATDGLCDFYRASCRLCPLKRRFRRKAGNVHYFSCHTFYQTAAELAIQVTDGRGGITDFNTMASNIKEVLTKKMDKFKD